MKHQNTLPREAVEFHVSVNIFKNALRRYFHVGIVIPFWKVKRQTRCSETQDPTMKSIFYASVIAIFLWSGGKLTSFRPEMLEQKKKKKNPLLFSHFPASLLIFSVLFFPSGSIEKEMVFISLLD